MNKYGSEYYMQTDEYKARVLETSINNYGEIHFTKNKKVKEKLKRKLEEKDKQSLN